MHNDIIRKLRDHLELPLDTECSVVYLLAEIRKVLERQPRDEKPFALLMYCHWALHVDLTRSTTTAPFLRAIDSYVVSHVEGYGGNSNFLFSEQHALFEEFLHLRTFRKQLRLFLHAHDLHTDLCDNDTSWFNFLSAYARVIEDGTLSAHGDQDLRAVHKVTFKKGTGSSEDAQTPFKITWDIRLKNGTTMTFATTTHENMRAIKARISRTPTNPSAPVAIS